MFFLIIKNPFSNHFDQNLAKTSVCVYVLDFIIFKPL